MRKALWLSSFCLWPLAAVAGENTSVYTPFDLEKTCIQLEKALAYVGDDELVEVTPKSIRLRKAILDPHERKRVSRAKEAESAA